METDYQNQFSAEREAIVDIGKRIWMKGFVAANDGNISIKVGDNLVLCTPTGVSKGFMKPDQMALVDLQGNTVDKGSAGGPSSEVKMHLRVYLDDPNVGAVVHAHPPIATAYAILGEPLEANLLPEIALIMPLVPVAPYATPSTEDLPDSIAPFIGEYQACLLEQHGSLTWGENLEEAYLGTERVEYYANMLYVLHNLGRMREMSELQIVALKKQFGVL